MPKWWRGTIEEQNPLSEIISEFNQVNITVIKKTQYDAFFETHLQRLLDEKGISQIVITGVMTHLCCETTARSAFVRGFAVFFPVDCTATYTEEFHLATLVNLSHGFAIPTTYSELSEKLKGF